MTAKAAQGAPDSSAVADTRTTAPVGRQHRPVGTEVTAAKARSAREVTKTSRPSTRRISATAKRTATPPPDDAPPNTRLQQRPQIAVNAPPLSATQWRFLGLFATELVLRDPAGVQLDRVDDPRALARETAAKALDTASAWQAHLGAFYDVDGVRQLLGHRGCPVTRQAVSKRKGLLALTSGSGRVVYPSFQFVDRSLVAGLDMVLAALPESLVSRWTVASWLASPQREFGGERPIDMLARGAVRPVAAAAEDWARSLAA